MDKRLKVYLETSFVSYLTGRPTTKEPIATWQAASRQWWAAVAPSCDLFVSEHVWNEIQDGAATNVAQREDIIRDLPSLDGSLEKIDEMDVLLTWNCKHMANEFTLPKTYGVLKDAGLKCPVIITPKRYMEDEHGIRDTNG